MKTLFPKFSLAVFFLTATTHLSHAQYADGTGTGLHQNQIFWLEWGGPALTTTPVGFTSTNIAEGTYIWDLDPGLVRVVGQLTNIGTPTPPASGTLSLTPYNSGTWAGNGTTTLGDGLQLMYPGVNPVGMANLLVGGPTGAYSGGVIKFDIDLKLQMFIAGVWTDLAYPGMVMADAESMNSNGQGTEYISANTNGATGWQILDVRNDAGTIGQDPTKYKLDISNGGTSFKLYNNLQNDMGVQAIMYAQGATTLTDVQMQGRGVTALALGFIAPFDFGDAPASYGDAIHYIDNLTLNSTPITADGTYTVTDQTIATLVTPTANVYINLLPDADGGLNHYSPNADVDGATTVPNYDGSGTYTLTIPITNNTGQPSNLGAWIDWNLNGVFDPTEGVLQTNPASATTATFTWNGLTTNPDPNVNYIVRVRVTTDPLTSPTGGSTDGEVEDYALRASISIAGNVFDDGDGLTNNIVDGTGTNLTGVLYVNLVDNTGVVVATAAVLSDGTYEFAGALSGNYTLQISTNQGVTGSPAPTITLPTGWVSTGENEGAGTGNDGTVNTILPITITAGVQITDANFGIEQLPVPTTPVVPAIQANPGGVATLDITSQFTGTDADGTVTSIHFVGFPNDATTITINGITYTQVSWPPSGVTVALSGLSVTIDPVDGTVTPMVPFRVIDNAGKESATTANSSTPLPVTLTSFTVTKEGKGGSTQLNWSTTWESNSDRFEIEHSLNGKIWERLGVVNAAAESNVLQHYSFVDAAPADGSNYYRLKMIDSDATFSYSRIVSIVFDLDVKVILYPNPVVEKLSIAVDDISTVEKIQICNVAGEMIYAISKPKYSSLSVDMRYFSAGLYLIRITRTNGLVNLLKAAKQ